MIPAQSLVLMGENTTANAVVTQQNPYRQRRDFWKTYIFWILCIATVAQGLAHFLPALYIPSYAADIGVSQEKASLLITAFQVTCMISQPLYGALVYVSPNLPEIFPSLAGSCIFTVMQSKTDLFVVTRLALYFLFSPLLWSLPHPYCCAGG
jgi:MFS family permease